MIITERFVFIHLHKTGGQTLNDILTRCIENHRVVGYHLPRCDVPVEVAHLPVVGMVRNPWDWYVSWYAFNRQPGIKNPLFNVVSDSGQSNFKSTVTNLINLGSDGATSRMYRNDLVRLLPDSLDGNRGVGLTKEDIRGFVDNETGYCSWLVSRMLGDPDNPQTYAGRFENLQDDFLAIMEQLSVSEVDAMRLEFGRRERKNVSRHSHYSHYYDDELCDLVADKERLLVQNFEYSFASIKPSAATYDFPASSYTDGNNAFRKLLGRESNYLQLHDDFDVSTLRKAIEQIPAASWLESEREKLFAVHKDTQSLLLVLFEDFKHEKPVYCEPYFDLQDALRPLIEYVSSYYQNNGFVVRLLLAKLVGTGKIPHHTDAGYSLLNCHRVHIPVVTSDEVVFSVGGEEKNMRVGEFWEINNSVDHAVVNHGHEDRIHIIIDWMPNFAGLPEEQVLRADNETGPPGSGAPAETLNAMIAQAHRVHQSGQVARAEPLYRQVLHLDADNVVANNLLGLLCLQTKRFDEARAFIERALAAKPDDAQAHANLALALKDLNQAQEAEQHFHESLKLNPNSPVVYNNLGSLYLTMRRVEDAITCYKQALTLQPAFAEAHHNLGSAQLRTKRYAEAVESLKQCVALKPDFAEAQIKLVEALREQGEQDKAADGRV